MIDVALLSVIRRWHLREGVSIREIARRAKLSRNTIRKYLTNGELEPVYPEAQEPEQARRVLTLHHDWAPQYRGEIFLPGPPARAGLSRAVRARRAKRDPRAEIPIGLIKGPPSRLRALATPEAGILHEPLNPSSILAFMLRYGVESGLPDPGLKEAFVLDFLTAMAACLCLVQIIAPHRIHEWGRPGQIFFACQEFFWTEDYGRGDPLWILNEPYARMLVAVARRDGDRA